MIIEDDDEGGGNQVTQRYFLLTQESCPDFGAKSIDSKNLIKKLILDKRIEIFMTVNRRQK